MFLLGLLAVFGAVLLPREPERREAECEQRDPDPDELKAWHGAPGYSAGSRLADTCWAKTIAQRKPPDLVARAEAALESGEGSEIADCLEQVGKKLAWAEGYSEELEDLAARLSGALQGGDPIEQ